MASVVKAADRTMSTSLNGCAAEVARESGHEFARVRTVPWAAMHALLALAIAMYSVVAAIRVPEHPPHQCRPYRVAIFLHVAFWFATLVVDWILKRAHHSLRVAGYLEFYQHTYALHRAPMYAVSLGTALLLVSAPLEVEGEAACAGEGLHAPVAHAAFLLSADAVGLLIIHSLYIYQVCVFNNAASEPDVHRQPPSPTSLGPSLSSHQSTLTQTADLLARQADLIRHLREHNEKLSSRLSAANSELRDLRHRNAAVNDAATPQA